jgi:hypothetical protein
MELVCVLRPARLQRGFPPTVVYNATIFYCESQSVGAVLCKYCHRTWAVALMKDFTVGDTAFGV